VTNRLTGVAILILTSTLCASPQEPIASPVADHGSPLISAFRSSSDDRLPAALDRLAPSLRQEIERRLARRDAYLVTIPTISNAAEKEEVTEARRRMEAGMVALIADAGLPLEGRRAIESEARAYARKAALYYEWEGYPEGPLAEANFGEVYLSSHPASVLRPAIELFFLYTYRAGFEAAVTQASTNPTQDRSTQDVERAKAGYAADRELAVRGYDAAWRWLARTTDPVVRAIANEIDRAPYLYLRVAVRVREPGRPPLTPTSTPKAGQSPSPASPG
jgi:hypothetical protein